ncbi:TIGR01458 family HAD-type hydrolase [soil metagenome]|jgi:HAD superfamily hydrolase (TIGR01458 family)
MNIKGLLIDLDGTLYEDDVPIEGAGEALARLKTSGLVLRYVTNTTRRSRSAIYERLTALGFDVEEDEILTPARVAARLIGDRTCFPLVDEALHEDLNDVSLTDESPDYVLVGDLGEGFTYGRLNEAFRIMMNGAELLALQKNRYWSTDGELSLDAGPFVAALEYAGGKTATVVGKPEENFFRLALEALELEPAEVAMVGDDPESDVAGAQAAGLYGIQVKTGKYRPGNEAAPDLTIESFARLPEALDL